MRKEKGGLLLCCLVALGLLVGGCQGDSPSPGTRVETGAAAGVGESAQDNEASAGEPGAADEPEAAPAIETTMAEPEDGLLINEDVERTVMFRINTLAYELPGMDEVEAVNITYAFHGDRPLTMDVYYPPGTPDEAQRPAVVFGLGYKMSSESLRDEHFYTSWGRLVAAAGMIGIAYDTEQPDQDLEILIAFIQKHAAELGIDRERIGFHTTSANQPTVMSYLMQEGRSGIRFAVYYYGSTLTPDRKYGEEFGETCVQRGCLYDELADVTYVNPEIPLFMVKAGKDFVPTANEAIDYFAEYVRGEGAAVTVIEYEDGVHGFDTQQKTEEAAEIIAQTVAFMRENFGLEDQGSAGALVLYNGLVVTAAGEGTMANGAVVVENGLITAVGPEAEVTFPEGASLIDVEGRAILPGLIDARASDLLNRLELSDGRIDNVPLALYLTNALAAGVTTVRGTGWDWEEMQHITELRAALEAQGNKVPTVVIAGTSLAHRDSEAADRYAQQTVGVFTVEEARQRTERLIELGADQIHLLQSVTQLAHLETQEGLPPTLSPEQLAAIVEVAHDRGKYVSAQAVFPEEAVAVLAAGVDELASWPSQASPMPDGLIQTLVEDSIPVVSGFFITPPQEGDVRRFLDAGGTLVFGTYAPNAHPLNSPLLEFGIMQLNGMTPMEMIEAATANAARAVGLGEVVGTLEAGKQADIIVVDGDPFENFGVMADVVYVVKGGELVVRPEAGEG